MWNQIRDYVTANPWLTAAVLYPLTTAIVSGVFHARSAGEYASKPARIAALYKLVAALGVDVEKATQSLLRFAFGATPKARAQALASLVAAMTIDPVKIAEALTQLVTGKRREDSGDGKPPSGGVAVLGLALCIGACRERPPCRPEQLALIESAYVSEALATCHGRTMSDCGELDAIRAKYRAKREEWVSCR